MSGSAEKCVLVVEDEADIRALVELHLRDSGYLVRSADCGLAARRALSEASVDLVILDRMLPDGDGLDLCRTLRAKKDYVPILMLTARSGEIDRVVGLEVGADDYLTKPFSIPELLARVKAILRRVNAGAGNTDETIALDDLVVDTLRREVSLSGRPITLTAMEFDLLLAFARHPGRVFSRAQLLEQVWGYAHAGYEHTVNSHINRLRSKIEPDPANPRYLLTVWGVGYRFFDPQRRPEEVSPGA